MGIPELKTSNLEPRAPVRSSLETGLTASSSRGWEPTLEAVGSGQVLLCACLAHRRSGWTPDSLAGRQGQALHGGANASTHGTQGPGCLQLSTLPSEPALPSGTTWAPAQPAACASSCLTAPLPRARAPFPDSGPRRPAVSGPLGTGALAGGLCLGLCI